MRFYMLFKMGVWIWEFRFTQHWPQKLKSSGIGQCVLQQIGTRILEGLAVSICMAEEWNRHRGMLIMTRALVRVVLFWQDRYQAKKFFKKAQEKRMKQRKKQIRNAIKMKINKTRNEQEETEKLGKQNKN